ncbi:Homoserine dehydrogenase [Thermocrinis albus DSM 14484]|uniref:Homoserine dehydrogenase n=1 Tax=Thermocrinis albus (strain DSM 14484 / JCM 11386 / HI 11/12) TaxID=638303 RepID=D3SQ03_THEAH|nr:homoserine dehydrogenase [Thermocrinis albus]ADC89240.1 Homoserine dehydrogenase [Thermocrinis albus DSM 14484]
MRVRVGIVGCGTVGTGTAELLLKNGHLIRKKTGLDIVLTKVADVDWERPRSFEVPHHLRTTHYTEVIEESDIVVELVGGKGFAKQVILEALEKGKHVVTANKHLLAEDGKEIFLKAQEKGLWIGFEASVGGGIPIVKALREGLSANRILNIYGILNGTTNYILTRMLEEDMTFDEALAEAKRMGYAEADPSLDIDGWDSAHKITILATVAFGKFFPFGSVHVEGIRQVDLLDVELGKELGYTLKLLAICKRVDSEVELRVHPTFIPSEEQLAKVSDVFNAVMVEGDFVGKTMFYGRGAGSHPTASAVVADIIDIARNIAGGIRALHPFYWEEEELHISSNFYSRYYLRLDVPDRPGVLAKVAQVLGDNGISIASVLQKEKVCRMAGREGQSVIPLVLLTHKAYEKQMRKAIEEIKNLPMVEGHPVLIRVEEEKL